MITEKSDELKNDQVYVNSQTQGAEILINPVDQNNQDNKETEDNQFITNLKRFYDQDNLELKTQPKVESIKTLEDSANKEIFGEYIICTDFTLSDIETGKVALAYKNGINQLLVVKEKPATRKSIKRAVESESSRAIELESFLEDQNFTHPSVILPIESITTNNKLIRFYEAGDLDLEKYLETNNQLPLKTSLSILIRICDGVSALHKIGMANLDLSPLNTIITKDSVKITDFESASIDISNKNEFQTVGFAKNRFTSSPELFKNQTTVDRTVDIYSAGTILYRLISGDWPYNIEKQARENELSSEDKKNEYIKLHESGQVDFPDLVPEEIRKIIEKAMNPLPKNRYQSMEEFMADMINVYNKINTEEYEHEILTTNTTSS